MHVIYKASQYINVHYTFFIILGKARVKATILAMLKVCRRSFFDKFSVKEMMVAIYPSESTTINNGIVALKRSCKKSCKK